MTMENQVMPISARSEAWRRKFGWKYAQEAIIESRRINEEMDIKSFHLRDKCDVLFDQGENAPQAFCYTHWVSVCYDHACLVELDNEDALTGYCSEHSRGV